MPLRLRHLSVNLFKIMDYSREADSDVFGIPGKKPCRACGDFKTWISNKNEELKKSDSDPQKVVYGHFIITIPYQLSSFDIDDVTTTSDPAFII